MPAFFAVIRTVTMTDDFTLRKRMKMIWSRPTGALERIDCHHSQNAPQTNPRIRIATIPTMNRPMIRPMMSKDMPTYLSVSCGSPLAVGATNTMGPSMRSTTTPRAAPETAALHLHVALAAVEARAARRPRRSRHHPGGAGTHTDRLGIVVVARLGVDLAPRHQPA